MNIPEDAPEPTTPPMPKRVVATPALFVLVVMAELLVPEPPTAPTPKIVVTAPLAPVLVVMAELDTEPLAPLVPKIVV